MCMHAYYLFSLKAYSFSLQSDFTNYWPSFHNTTFSFFPPDLCEQFGKWCRAEHAKEKVSILVHFCHVNISSV